MSDLPQLEATDPVVRLFDAYNGRPRHEGPSLISLAATPGVRRLKAGHEQLVREIRLATLKEVLAVITPMSHDSLAVHNLVSVAEFEMENHR
jgi:hypothetical protein